MRLELEGCISPRPCSGVTEVNEDREAIMARSSTITAAKQDEVLIMSRVAGVLALGLAVLLEALAVTPFLATPKALITPLLLAALVQIGAGLDSWRHDRVLESVVFLAFGLFTCSQISQLGKVSLAAESPLAPGAFLLLWGVFALLIAVQPSDSGRFFHHLLAAVASTLLGKALLLVFSWHSLWALPLLCGVLTFSLAILTVLRHLPALRS